MRLEVGPMLPPKGADGLYERPPRRYLGYWPLAIRCRLFGHEWQAELWGGDEPTGTWRYQCHHCARFVNW